MSKAGGFGGDGGFEGIDFSKFGSGPGGMPAEEEGSDDEELPEDDDMPALEGEEKEDVDAKTHPGIQEVE